MSRETHLPSVLSAIIAHFFLSTHAIAYDLGEVACGGEYGSLNIIFSSNISSFDQIEHKISRMQGYSSLYRNIYLYDQKIYTSLKRELKRAWINSRNNDSYLGKTDISVPVGSENYIVEYMIRNDIINKATYAVGDCGGSEISYAFIGKSKTGLHLSNPVNFERYLRSAIGKYVSGAEYLGFREEGPLNTSPIEPNYPTKRFTIAVPSQISRGPQRAGTWDKFDIIFTLYRETKP